MSSDRALYGSTIFCSAFLLFLIEPIAAKEILPALGGSSAVWMTCLVFFQAMLLTGYLYAHWLTRLKANPIASAMNASRIHLVLIITATLLTIAQLAIHPSLTRAAQHPASAIFLDLAATIGLPFLLLACSSPLLQVWFARRENTAVPYRLFGLSNAGSLLALILYPVAVEPYLTLRHQRLVWSIGFVLVALLHGVVARQNDAHVAETPELSKLAATPTDTFAASSTRRQKLLWFFLPMVAAMQLSAVTGFLSQNIAAIPLLWILPLATYLFTFIAAFDAPRFYRRGLILRFLVVLLAALGYMLSKMDMSLPIGLSVAFFVIELFFGCYFLHAETYALRPERDSEATLFYLLIAAGGVAGSFFIGVASPLIFNANYDIAISFAATAAAALVVVWGGSSMVGAGAAPGEPANRSDLWPQRLLWITATVLMICLIILMYRSFNRDSLVLVRNFYGTLSVRQSNNPPVALTVRSLQNGSIQHGTQWFAPEFRSTPTTYYAQNSGVGLALQYCCFEPGAEIRTPRRKNVGIIGLGAGTLAAYGNSGDQFTFYEINPGVEPIARNLFTYIRDSAAHVKILEGDARITLENQPSQQYDVLVVDAFSGDAIPLHLLTREAIALYCRHLAPGGVLAFHVSNQYLDLAPEVALLAASQGLRAVSVQSLPNEQKGAFASSWILVTNNLAFLNQPEIAKVAKPIAGRRTRSSTAGRVRLWTDDFSSLLPILRWSRR